MTTPEQPGTTPEPPEGLEEGAPSVAGAPAVDVAAPAANALSTTIRPPAIAAVNTPGERPKMCVMPTVSKNVSCSEHPRSDEATAAFQTRFPWVSTAPLGRPVVPEV